MTCQHIWNAHRQCQWCHRMRIDIETDAMVSEARDLIGEFRRLSSIPVGDPPRGLQVSRSHFEEWADRLESAIPEGK